jgi:hypothetical protein
MINVEDCISNDQGQYEVLRRIYFGHIIITHV